MAECSESVLPRPERPSPGPENKDPVPKSLPYELLLLLLYSLLLSYLMLEELKESVVEMNVEFWGLLRLLWDQTEGESVTAAAERQVDRCLSLALEADSSL